MKTGVAWAVLASSFLCAVPVEADVFGSGENSFAIEFVAVGDPGNVADTTGLPNPAGAVGYENRIGKYEISEDFINKANALGGLGITHDNRGAIKPATSVSWFEAARFVNWLNTSTGSPPAYKFDLTGNFQLWQSGDEGYDPNNLYRNSLARYFLPSTHEWYKAAYYDPVAEVYYDYPTGSDSQPDGLQDEDDPEFDAVFFDGDFAPEPNDATNVGITSPYGTAGQGGNVAEWIESAESLDNGQPPTGRHVRGGQWNFDHTSLRSNIVGGGNASTGHSFVGFRVASATSIVLSGDFNEDGAVDAADYVVWRKTSGTNAQFETWRANFGSTLGNSSGFLATVPEPATAGSLLLGAILCFFQIARSDKRDRQFLRWP